MTTELSFLLDLLLNHKLPKPTKDAVAERIKVVEEDMREMFAASGIRSAPIPQVQAVLDRAIANQAPSMQAIMARNPDLVAAPPIPVENIAQTPAAQAAMASRQSAIAESMAGKVDKVSGRPRKF